MKQMLGTNVAFLFVVGTALPLVPGTARAMDGLAIEMGGKGQFLHGALLGIPVVYTCPKSSMSPSLLVQLAQASGSDVVDGVAVEDALECDGEPKETLVLVMPTSTSPFRRSKDIVVDVNMSACDDVSLTCGDVSAGPVVLSLRR
ncbi:hypothetical protein [Polyangium mundeleinium]|uniref:Uncharacterized protein n=1 Tax=Polyangium mundeleinium TaxID=2995306 RepID=A0ABT5EW99_9BACT|nr:hypothetical protein [Polyangium mundeleinium]MDC0746076.1 hypothetical protein [Polyangium mundeleinium]